MTRDVPVSSLIVIECTRRDAMILELLNLMRLHGSISWRSPIECCSESDALLRGGCNESDARADAMLWVRVLESNLLHELEM